MLLWLNKASLFTVIKSITHNLCRPGTPKDICPGCSAVGESKGGMSMSVFESKDKMVSVLGGLFENLLEDTDFGPTFVKADIIVKFNISDPNAELWITPGDGTTGQVLWGSKDLKPTVEMTLSSDTCHKFWLKQISMPIALAKGQIKAKGPMPKVLKLLPMLKPAYQAYPDWAKSQGLPID
jgi:hypothetical protein